MKKWIPWAVLAALLSGLFCPALAYETRDELRSAYRDLGAFEGETPYLQKPKTDAPYDAGELDPAARADALKYLNFLRNLAGLDGVSESEIYDYQCQHGATLLAALDYVDHNAPRPEDMDANFYDSAHLATSSSNIAKFNWMRPSVLREGIAYFVRDDGENNLPVLGHRRWLLNPEMNATGFGLANAASGMSYVAMYAHDLGRPDAAWSEVCWPSAGAFPVELMHANLAWSVSLNPEIYDVERSQIIVTLTEARSGMSFSFQPASGAGDGFCTVSMENYGAGPCVIFRPDFSDWEFTDYLQNQVWQVRLTGLIDVNGEERTLEYAVEMVSLYVQEAVNVELNLLEAELRVGERTRLSAAVIPEYADDLTVTWWSTDPAVASVDEAGEVTALAPGVCEIVAESVNGRSDRCAVAVRE